MAKRWSAVVALLMVAVLAACGTSGSSSDSSTTKASSDPQKAAAIEKIVEDLMASKYLKSVIVRVTEDGDEVIKKAFGESQTGIPATADMSFRNGSVAIGYVAAVLLQLVDEGTVALDDIIGKWVPEIPHAGEVTLGQLATMTSGYQDYTYSATTPSRRWSSPTPSRRGPPTRCCPTRWTSPCCTSPGPTGTTPTPTTSSSGWRWRRSPANPSKNY